MGGIGNFTLPVGSIPGEGVTMPELPEFGGASCSDPIQIPNDPVLFAKYPPRKCGSPMDLEGLEGLASMLPLLLSLLSLAGGDSPSPSPGMSSTPGTDSGLPGLGDLGNLFR